MIPESVRQLRTAHSVRERCHELLQFGLQGQLEHFSIVQNRLAITTALVIENMVQNYPSLEIPYHSRWRHFETGGTDRWTQSVSRFAIPDSQLPRIRTELTIVSVLLDAGAGDAWRYCDPHTEQVFTRSEGLAIASLDMYLSGGFSSDPEQPLQVDATALQAIDSATLGGFFQVQEDNQLAGLSGRANLLNSLGHALQLRTDIFGDKPPRLGVLYDHLCSMVERSEIDAPSVLASLLNLFSDIWPGREQLQGHSLGDVWRHSALKTDDQTSHLVPFHKLSQWLTYSLIEVFEDSGCTVHGLEYLTGLAEYRNGGLFVDTGVITPRDQSKTYLCHQPGDEFIVEWRALTVALLDVLGERIRSKLSLASQAMPLARILQGGTWSTGRTLAAKLRDNANPPFTIASDGTVF